MDCELNSAYDINLYIADACRDLYYGLKKNVMKKEYMKKRVEKWCESHDCHLEVYPSGVVCLCYHTGEIDSELFTSLSSCYKYLFDL